MTIDYSIKVTQCEPMPGYKLKVTCSDGATGIFDMSRYVDRGMFKPLKDPQTFDRVRLAFGVPSWPGDIDIAAERVRSDMQILEKPTRPCPDRHQDCRGFFMPVCMTDMTRHQRPTGPAIFSRGLLVSLLQVSKPIAVSTTDDWRKTPAVPSRPWAKGARSERDHPSRHSAIMPCEIAPNQ